MSARNKSEKSDGFGTFLETFDNPKKSEPQNEKTIRIELLKVLAISGAQPVQNLFGRVNVGVVEFAQTLKQIQEAGLVSVKGSGSDETAELTPQGTMLMKLNMM